MKFFFLLLLMSVGHHSYSSTCQSYLSLNQEQLVALDQLARLRIKLDEMIMNPNSDFPLYRQLEFDYERTKIQFEAHLLALNLDLGDLLTRTIEKIQLEQNATQKLQRHESQTQNNLVEDIIRPVFRFIPSGVFRRVNIEIELETVNISNSFYLLDSLVTQEMWSRVVRLIVESGAQTNLPTNPSAHPHALRPVEGVSPSQMIDWIDSLNTLSQSQDPSIQAELAQVLSGHRSGDVYRLPSLNELEYLVRNGEEHREWVYPSKTHIELVLEHAQWENDREKVTSIVKTFPSLKRFGHEFFDLWGNLKHLVNGHDGDGPLLKTGLSTQDRQILMQQISIFGRYVLMPQFAELDATDKYVGLRLVRQEREP